MPYPWGVALPFRWVDYYHMVCECSACLEILLIAVSQGDALG